MTVIKQYNFIEFCFENLRKQREIVSSAHTSVASPFRGNCHFALYQKINTFFKNRPGNYDWGYFDDFLYRYPDCTWKIRDLRALCESLGNVSGLGNMESKWIYEDLEVIVKPNICLRINDQCHLIKLYLRKDRLRQDKKDAYVHLMGMAFPSLNEEYFYTLWDLSSPEIEPIYTVSGNNLNQVSIANLEQNARHFIQLEREMFPEVFPISAFQNERRAA